METVFEGKMGVFLNPMPPDSDGEFRGGQRPSWEFRDGRKNEPTDSANRTNLISQGKYLFSEYPVAQ